jgi:signal peptidase I
MAKKATKKAAEEEGVSAKGAAAEDGPAPARKGSALVEWIKSLAIAAILFLVLRTFLVQTFVITSGSMEDTLLVGDMLVANRLAIGARIPGTQVHIPGYSEPRRGDVMIFDPHHEVGMKLAKRIAGLPGDTLQMRDGVLIVNGGELSEPYVKRSSLPDQVHPDFEWQRDYLLPSVDAATYTPTMRTWGPIVVPAEHYFMMGDNRDESFDSRYWGPLAGWRLEARVSFLYFSYNSESYRPFPAVREVRWDRVGRGLGGGR